MPVCSKTFSKLLSRETRENTHVEQAQAAKTCRYFLFTQDSPNSQLEFPRSQILGTALSTQRLEQSLELPSAGAGEETFVSAEPCFFFLKLAAWEVYRVQHGASK